MTRPRLISSRDLIQAINRRGNALLDPARHAHEEAAGSPFAPSVCRRCGLTRAEHWSWLRRAWERLARWRRG